MTSLCFWVRKEPVIMGVIFIKTSKDEKGDPGNGKGQCPKLHFPERAFEIKPAIEGKKKDAEIQGCRVGKSG